MRQMWVMRRSDCAMNTPHFNTQSILAAETREICALEILSRRLPSFDDEVEMLELDIAALEQRPFLRTEPGFAFTATWSTRH